MIKSTAIYKCIPKIRYVFPMFYFNKHILETFEGLVSDQNVS